MPGGDVAIRIARALGVSVEWLVTGEEPPGTAPASDVDTLLLPFYNVFGLAKGVRPTPDAYVPVRRDWLTPRALAAPALWFTTMPATSAHGLPPEGTQILCCDTDNPREPGDFLYCYLGLPRVRRFVPPEPGDDDPAARDITVYEFDGMELVGRVLGLIRLVPA